MDDQTGAVGVQARPAVFAQTCQMGISRTEQQAGQYRVIKVKRFRTIGLYCHGTSTEQSFLAL